MRPREAPFDLGGLEERIGHVFADRALLERALTHSSCAHEDVTGSLRDNEPLEFLGDAVLGMLVTDALHRRDPDGAEGEKSRRRAQLVSSTSLARHAAKLGLPEMLLLGRGEEKNDGREKPSILADAVEAIVGAVFLDGGLGAAQAVVHGMLGDALDDAAGGAVRPDVKTALQERLQAGGGGTPSYLVVGTSGPEHSKVFEVQIVLNDEVIARGRGRSKKEAEKDAARNALGGAAADGGER